MNMDYVYKSGEKYMKCLLCSDLLQIGPYKHSPIMQVYPVVCERCKTSYYEDQDGFYMVRAAQGRFLALRTNNKDNALSIESAISDKAVSVKDRPGTVVIKKDLEDFVYHWHNMEKLCLL